MAPLDTDLPEGRAKTEELRNIARLTDNKSPMMVIKPLDRDAIHEMVAGMLGTTKKDAKPPARLVDELARVSGGLGPCGRPLCCATFMERFHSVTVRMAKRQNLSLNPTKISGLCGRLMCCLAHEVDQYPEKKRSS